MENQDMQVAVGQAPIVKNGGINTYWTYSFITRSQFYAMIAPQYQDFMLRFVKNWLWWADGWVPYFHSAEYGIPSTRLGQALIDKAARKIVGGRIMFKNAGKDSTKESVNPAIKYLSDWARETNFEETVKKAVRYAAAAGTALLKLTSDNEGNIRMDAMRFDTFMPAINSKGEVEAVECFIKAFTDLGVKVQEGTTYDSYYLVEKRYYGDYTKLDGTVIENAPLCEYCIKQARGTVTNGEFIGANNAGYIPFKSLPPNVRKAIGRAYKGTDFETPILLPFKDLGCEIVKFTEGVTGIPELPFGESLLSNIITHLEEWDYYHACSMTDMYLGRGRVIAPKAIQGVNSGFNSGLDEFIFTQWQTQNPDAQKPVPIQFELRAGEWDATRTRIIQDISIETGLNISTIASFVSDNTARTAREISTEENETAAFANDKRALIEKPFNKLLATLLEHACIEDIAVIRWSAAGLTNRFSLAEIIQMGLQNGFISKYQAVQMFNFDDDTEQVQEEFERLKAEEKEKTDSQKANLWDFGDTEKMNV